MSDTASRFIKNIGFNIISDVSTKFTNSILIILISRFLGVTTLGSYTIAYTYFNFGLLFSLWGFRNLLIRGVAQNRKEYNKYFFNFSIIRLILSLLAIIAIYLIVRNLTYTDITYRVITIISIGIMAHTLVQLQFSLFIAFEKLKYLSIVSFTTSLIKLIISIIVIYSKSNVITIAIILTIIEFISLIISSIITLYVFPGLNFNFDLKFSINEIKKGFPLFLIAIFGILDNRLDVLIISLFFNEEAVGYYAAMNTLVGGLILLSEGIRNAIFPILARYKITNNKKLEEILQTLGKYIIIITFPISVLTYLYAEDIINLLFGSEFILSVTMLRIVVWILCGYSLIVVNTRLLIVHDKENQVVLLFFISGFLTLILNVLFTPRLGIISVAYIRLTTTYIMLLTSLIFLYNRGYRLKRPKIFLNIFLACFIMITIVLIFQPNRPLLGFTISLILYSLLIIYLDVITSNDVKLWKGILHNFLNSSE